MFCFYGNYSYQLDAKNRMRMPAKYRAEMGNEYLITRGTSGCLFVLDSSALATLNEKIAAVPFTDIEGGNALRKFTASAVTVECDEQGRFILPPQLKKYANIDKNVCIVGAGNKVEIWSQEAWDKQNEQDSAQAFDQIFSGLSKFGV